jgi:putative ABC transport system permease protein
VTALRTGWAQRGVLVALGVLVCITSLLLTAAPRALGRAYDEAARQEVGPVELTISGNVAERSLRSVGDDGPKDDRGIQAVTQALQDLWPARLKRIVRPSAVTAVTPMTGMPLPEESRSLTLMWDAQMAAHIRYVEGQAPQQSDPRRPVVQIGLSVATARKLRFAVGRKVTMKGVTVQVSGLFEAISATDPFWVLRPAVLTPPDVPISAQLTTVSATGVMDAGGYEALHAHGDFTVTYFWKYHVEPAALHAEDVTAAATDVTEMKSLMVGTDLGMPLQLSTSLADVLTSFAAQLRVTQSILYLVLGGLAAVAVGVLVLVCGLLLDRLRVPLATMRARGASVRQIGLIVLGAVAPVVVPSAMAGALLGLLVPGTGVPWAGAVAMASVALAVPTVIT